jgi:hypothetical protein
MNNHPKKNGRVWFDRVFVYGWLLMSLAAYFWRGPLDALAVLGVGTFLAASCAASAAGWGRER